MSGTLIGYARCSTDEQDGTGEYTIADLAEVFTVSRTTVYRTLQRAARSRKVS
jgi:DNA invertase Pin-like site-specific DNA recombinase